MVLALVRCFFPAAEEDFFVSVLYVIHHFDQQPAACQSDPDVWREAVVGRDDFLLVGDDWP